MTVTEIVRVELFAEHGGVLDLLRAGSALLLDVGGEQAFGIVTGVGNVFDNIILYHRIRLYDIIRRCVYHHS